MDIKHFRKVIREWLFENIVGKKVYNSSISNYIIFNKRGLKHATSFSNQNYVQKLKSFYSIEGIVKNAILYKTEVDNRGRDNIQEILLLKNRLVVEEQSFEVKVVVRHTNEGRFYYDHALRHSISN